ncbi:MAG: glycoside hydrolase family 3 C-terminal domain-containing protein [Bacilli bacterium]|nr:glycoside hydrolase family 3 C-terminal domain-containing protein [Bacilli bacterium]
MSNEEVKKLLETIPLAEKIKLLTGANFWESVTVPNTDLPHIVMNDGPFGVRKPKANEGTGIIESSYKATAYPTTTALASTFDPDLIYKMGQTLANECIDQGVDILLGPGLNIKRSPLCGRNFEYFSEDPHVTAKLGGALVKGLQSKGVGATIKHYAVNNQEKERFTTNAIVDERALEELYLKAFHDVIKDVKPWAVMCSYNRVNGMHASRSHRLLTEKLRHNAKFDGLVMSDWGAVVKIVDSVNTGLNLEMPGGYQNTKELEDALKSGVLTEEKVNEMITPLLRLMINKRDNPHKEIKCDYDKNLQIASEIVEKSAVLLKNDDNILPLNKNVNVALIGNFAKTPRYQGSGSSRINPYKLVSLYDAFVNENVNFVYADGYKEHEVAVNTLLIKEAVEIAKTADVVLICAGLPESYEVEGYDRQTLALPPSHNELISELSKVNKKIIVILSTGSPVTMPWLNDVKGVLLTHLGGSATGSGTYNLVFGNVTPSGKLSETYPLSLLKSIPGESFLTSDLNVPYLESLYVGYRYYDTFNEQVLFPFGYGLSYTQFKCSDYDIETKGDKYKVTLNVTNIGHLKGAEVIGVYIGREFSKLFSPRKELKGFTKVELEPGEKKKVSITFTKDDLKAYDPIQKKWVLENIDYSVYVGIDVSKAENMFFISIEDGENLEHLKAYKELNSVYYSRTPFKPTINDFTTLYGEPLPLVFANRKRPFTLEGNISDVTDYWWGRTVHNIMINVAGKMAGDDPVLKRMAQESIKELPFRSMVALSSGAVSENKRDALLLLINGKPLRGLARFLKKDKRKVK